MLEFYSNKEAIIFKPATMLCIACFVFTHTSGDFIVPKKNLAFRNFLG